MARSTADVLREIQSSDSTPSEYRPSASEADLITHVTALFDEARRMKDPIMRQWRRNYNALRNRRRDVQRRPDQPAPDLPEIYPICASFVGWINKRQPQFECSANAPALSQASIYYNQLADDLNAVMNANWINHKYHAQLKLADWDLVTYGTAIVAAVWDNSVVGGLGNAVLRRVDPFTFYPDPKATSMEDANFFIEYRELSVQDVDRRFRGMWSKLDPMRGGEGGDVPRSPRKTDGSNSTTPFANPGAISPNTSPDYFPPRSPAVANGRGVPVLEAWLRQHTWEKVTRKDPTTGEDNTHFELHDGWRYVAIAQNRVLADMPVVDMWDHGQPPYSRYVAEDHGEFWGESLVELLTSSQLSINDILEAMHRNINLIGNPIFLADDRSGIKRSQLVNRPGGRLTKAQGSEVTWLTPPDVQPQVVSSMISFYKGEMESISGLSALVRGFSPSGRNSEGVIDTVQDASLVRINSIIQNREDMMTELGMKLAALIAEFYDTPRTMAILGDDGQKTALALRSMHFYAPSKEGRLPVRFQIRVEAGSSLPTSFDSLASLGQTLFTLGAIDEEALLEILRFPNRLKIVARVRELKAAGMLEPPGARKRARA